MALILAKILTFVLVAGFGALGLWWSTKFENPSKDERGAQRLPKLVKVASVIVLIGGLLILLPALAQGADEDIAMTIVGAGISILGILMLMYYRNFWVMAQPHMLRWRNAVGEIKQITSAEVTRISAVRRGIQEFAKIESPVAKIELNPRVFDLSSFLKTVDPRVFRN